MALLPDTVIHSASGAPVRCWQVLEVDWLLYDINSLFMVPNAQLGYLVLLDIPADHATCGCHLSVKTLWFIEHVSTLGQFPLNWRVSGLLGGILGHVKGCRVKHVSCGAWAPMRR